MELKLGELLLREKLITAKQLEVALKNQVVFGIRLGSALIEMGYVEEDALARVLSTKLGVPFVGSSELSSIPRDVINDFSRAMVIRYQVMPFKLERNRLGLAMTNPNDLKAIEEISFITGHVVQPYVAPDVQISHAQAKYYRISESDARYQHIAELKRLKDKADREQEETVAISAMTETGEMLNVLIPAEFEDFASLNDVLNDESSLPQVPKNPDNLESISLELAEARSRDDVADVLVRYLGREFGTGALFVLRGTVAMGWRGVTKGSMIDDIKSLSLVMSKPSVLRDVVETRAFALGPLVSTPENLRILQVLALADDTPLFAVPVIMMGKAVAVVLVEADMDDLVPRLNELQNLIRKMSLAFEMLIVKNKILMV
ncbi:MAG: hypothetical protein HXX11_01290 [Desulfuromonadales bacterium]|nr:hypothetical protein [Desulfuromonadales bacterium]